jgi:O-antigen/teichoic acid export membrane protein
MLMGLGRLREMMWLLVAWTIANVALSVTLVGPLGVNGVVVATLACSAVLVVPIARIFLHEVRVSALEFVRAGLLPVVPGVVVQVGVGLLLLPLANDSDRLWAVGLYGLLTIVTGLAVFVLVGLRAPQRAELARMVRNSLGRGPQAAAADGTGPPDPRE